MHPGHFALISNCYSQLILFLNVLLSLMSQHSYRYDSLFSPLFCLPQSTQEVCVFLGSSLLVYVNDKFIYFNAPAAHVECSDVLKHTSVVLDHFQDRVHLSYVTEAH